jgi:hypothetical protein
METTDLEKIKEEINRLHEKIAHLNTLLLADSCCLEEFLLIFNVSRGHLFKKIALKRNDPKAAKRYELLALLHGIIFEDFIKYLQQGFLKDADVTDLEKYRKMREKKRGSD